MTEAEAFEELVRRMARSMWDDPSAGRAEGDPVRRGGGRAEIDVLVTRSETIVIDATISTQAQMVRDKIQSLKSHRRSIFEKTGRPVRAFIVTKNEPTQHQISALKDAKIDWILLHSYSQFRSLLVDATGYIAARTTAPFGSVRSLEVSPGRDFPRHNFVRPTFRDPRDGREYDFASVVRRMADKDAGHRMLIAGVFGMGKSMTSRAIFYDLADRFNKDEIDRFPIHLNLNEHQGQIDPDEALRRHASKIGKKAQADGIIQAWRADLTSIILDGFDELVATPWSYDIAKRREVRRMSMLLIKNFISESPKKTPVLIAGRWTYFNDTQEMYLALGINPESDRFLHLDISDFNQHQMAEFLRKIGKPRLQLPDWLPRRPLLVGYLATTTDSGDNSLLDVTASIGWNRLLDMICAREELQNFRLDRTSVRTILEGLATYARETEDGLGAFSDDLVLKVFASVTGATPDAASINAVLRLPFLRPMPDTNGFRAFLDGASADALRAGDVVRYINTPSERDSPLATVSIAKANKFPSTQLTVNMIVDAASCWSLTRKQLMSAAERMTESGLSGIAGEIAVAALQIAPTANDSSRAFVISDARFSSIDLADVEGDGSNVSFSSSAFDILYLDYSTVASVPMFFDCLFDKVFGIASIEEFPEKFDGNCSVEKYDSSFSTNASAAGGSLPPQLRAMQTVVRKLFFQRGAARQENAFYKGALPDDVKRAIGPVLEIMCREGFCSWETARNGKVLVPDRRKTHFARELLEMPATTQLNVANQIRQLRVR